MADLNSWEDDKDAQDENLSRQTQRMNMNNNFTPGAGSFTPGASSFQPGAASFQQYQQYPQYGQQQQFSQYGQYQQQGAYPQYGQQQQGQQQPGQQQQGYGQQQAYSQYGGYNGQQQQQSYQQYNQQYQQYSQPQASQQQAKPPVQIAKRPAAGASASAASSGPAPVKTLDTGAPKTAKVLSIGATGEPKVEKTGGAKVLSIGTPAAPVAKSAPPAKQEVDKSKPEAGAKVAAAKAVDSKSAAAKAAPASGQDSPTPAEKSATANRKADAVIEEQDAELDAATLQEIYGKEHVNMIVLGHVDAGKSTLGGSLLYATGMVDERTMDKLKREAKEAGRETWYLSWALDLTKEERLQGKTVEVGRGFFETDKRKYSILDAPGHKTYVPHMIGGASQADVGVLVISARKGEYETGFEKGGQTREHAVLAKTQGVNKLLVVVNKMDDESCPPWSHERYIECTTKLTTFLKGVGYNPKTDLTFMPVSAQTGLGIKNRVPKDVCPWYKEGPSLLDFLDNMPTVDRKLNAPFMMPVAAKYKDMGTMIEGKIEAGVLKSDGNYLMMPNREKISISALFGEAEDAVTDLRAGDQARIRLRGIEEEDILPGFVLCDPKRPVHNVSVFEAQIVLLDLRSILSAGYNCVMHVHAAQIEVSFAALLHKLEKGTGRKSKKAPGFATKGMSIIARLEVTGGTGSVCVERFEDYPQMGRFTLRDSGQTVAIGKITKLLSTEEVAAVAAETAAAA